MQRTVTKNRTWLLVMTGAVFLSLLIGIASCKAPPEPIVMTDVYGFEKLEYTVTDNTTEISLLADTHTLNIEDASDTEAFLSVIHIMEILEREIFELAKAENPMQPLPTSSFHSQETISLDITAINTTDSSKEDYRLSIDMAQLTGVLSGNGHHIVLEHETVRPILASPMLPVDTADLPMPVIELRYGSDEIQHSIYGDFHQEIYPGRYSNHTINSRLTRTEDKTLTVTDTRETLNLTLSPEAIATPDIVDIHIYQSDSRKLISSDQLQPEGSSLSIGLPEDNDDYFIEIVCQWNTDAAYGVINCNFNLHMEKDEQYIFNRSQYEPGDLIVVQGINIDDDLNYDISTDIYNEGLQFVESGGSHYLLIPLMSKLEPGTYSLTVTDPDHPESAFSGDIEVIQKEFATQYLTTSGATAALQNKENYDQLDEAFERGRSDLSMISHWSGPFLQPVGGRISTEYGEIRYTNENVISSRHSGIDFANPTGTAVKATESGTVTLAEYLNITGNTIFIDHGFGIISQYYHLNDMYVDVGEEVTRGDTIGAVGTTGFSTGPHLHFAVYNNGIYINPWKLFEEAPF